MPHAVNAVGQVSNFPPTDPTETRNLTFDFSGGLATGETIVGIPVWTIDVYDGVDATPNSRLIGSPQIAGNLAEQLVGTCLAGVRYSLTAKAVTTTGQHLTAFGEITSVPNPP
jgi:hypothetical protein